MGNERSTTESNRQITGTGLDVRATAPTINSPIITGVPVFPSGGIASNIKFCTTEFDAVTGTTGATLTNIIGLTGFSLTAAGVYAFEINLGTVGTTNSGVKIGFALTTATLTSIEYDSTGFGAAAVVASRGTTATSGTAVFGSTTAILVVRITGQLVVNAAGTIAIQAAQNAAHADTTSVFVGSWARFTRVS